MNQLEILEVGAKNFLAIGNDGIEYKFAGSHITLFSGKSGAGKTSVLEALVYVFYNKSFRGVNLKQLINSVNKKGMQCYAIIARNGYTYKITRGMLPKKVLKLERFVDGELEYTYPDSSDVEVDIANLIGISYKTFQQTVIMASMGFDNFLELPVADRRQIINQMLDLEVLTGMIDINKKNAKRIATDISNLQNDKAMSINKQQSLETIIKNAQTVIQSGQHDYDGEVEKLKIQIDDIKEQIAKLDFEKLEKENGLPSVGGIHEEITILQQQIGAASNNRAVIQSEVNRRIADNQFYQTHDQCDRCAQLITPEHKQAVVQKLYGEAMQLKEQYDAQQNTIDACNTKIAEFSQKIAEYNAQCGEVNEIVNRITYLNNQIGYIQNQINGLLVTKSSQQQQTVIDTSNEQQQLIEISSHIDDVQEQIVALLEEQETVAITASMLSDSGFKAQIIKEYLPFINERMNEYLEMLGADYCMELDEQFNETILSRYRDDFSYKSFSNGERCRINFSILFTMRDVAVMRASVSTNLLFIDEVMDNSNDTDGINCLAEILHNMKNMNISIISHRQEVKDSNIYDRTVDVVKDGLFSSYDIVDTYR